LTLFQVKYLPEANDAIRIIYRYIAREEGQGRADGWLDQFTESADKLAHEALTWPVVTTRLGKDVRSKLAIVHRVYYRVEEATKTVWIIDAVHTARQTKLDEYRDDE